MIYCAVTWLKAQYPHCGEHHLSQVKSALQEAVDPIFCDGDVITEDNADKGRCATVIRIVERRLLPRESLEELLNTIRI